MFLTELQTSPSEKAPLEVRMFVHNSPDAAEKEINDWLQQQQIRICHITQSQCERQGRFVFVVSMFYEKM